MNLEKPIEFSQHALDNMIDRGASIEEVKQAITTGEWFPAKKGRLSFRKNFNYTGDWKGRHYQMKQVMPIVAEETDRLVIVTVYVFFFGVEK